jgi:signal transduction histidine kinase
MMQLVKIPVENEMDLTLAYKKTIKACDLLGLSLSIRTAFATAVSEVCREVIDKTENGNVSIEVEGLKEPFQLAAIITFLEDKEMGSLEQGLQYARKLVPYFQFSTIGNQGTVQLKWSIPRTAKITKVKLMDVKGYFESVEPTTPYEEIRQRNAELYLINEQSEIALLQSEYLNQQKTEFLSVASHELKTPLTILRAFTQMALREGSHIQTLSHLEKIDVQARKIQTLIQQLLDIAKVENGQAHYNNEEVDFNAYFSDMAELIAQLVPTHQLVIELGETRLVFIDKLRIEQVIMNIAGNAAKYSAPGTCINISTTISDAGDLIIAFKDQGIGMSADELQKVFDKFYRVESVIKKYIGFGMGLYISSKIINDHGGELWAESTGSSGSTFKIRLPVIN